MPGTQTKDIKSAARQLVDSLPDDATWDDVMYRVYVRQAIDAGRQDAAEGRLVDVAVVRRQFGLPVCKFVGQTQRSGIWPRSMSALLVIPLA
jgi:hypothetical protein